MNNLLQIFHFIIKDKDYLRLQERYFLFKITNLIDR